MALTGCPTLTRTHTHHDNDCDGMQLFVAKRDNAKAIFQAYLTNTTGGMLPADRYRAAAAAGI